MTNYEQIKSKSLEETAEMLYRLIGRNCDRCPAIDICLREEYGIYNCLKAFEDWLNEDTPKTKCEKWKESLSRFKKGKEEPK
jgi:hypothetical protein